MYETLGAPFLELLCHSADARAFVNGRLPHNRSSVLGHQYDTEIISPLDLPAIISEGIAFLPSQDVGNLGLVYITLIWLTAVLVIAPLRQTAVWLPAYIQFPLVYTPHLKKPPRF